MKRSNVLVWIALSAIFAAMCGAIGGFFLARQFPGSVEGNSVYVGKPSSMEEATVSLEDRDISSLLTLDSLVVSSNNGYQLQSTVTSDAIAYQLATSEPYRVRAVINGRAGGFECSWSGVVAGDVPVSSGEQPVQGERPESSAGVTVACDIPEDVVVVQGLTGVMAIALESPQKVPTLPRTAVFGSQQSGVVIVVSDTGERQRREVTLGESDTQYVEIVSGLQPNEKVLAVPLETDLLSAP